MISSSNARIEPGRKPAEPDPPVAVVGIGADGWRSLPEHHRDIISSAEVIIGSWRQLHLIPDTVHGERRPWPSPLVPAVEEMFAGLSGTRVVVLASGDPMFHGIGTTLCRILGTAAVTVYPLASSVSVACARLGWPVETTPVVSLVTGRIEALVPLIGDGRPFVVLSRDETSPDKICRLLRDTGHDHARVTVLSDLGSADEKITAGTAGCPPEVSSALSVVAVIPQGPTATRLPGLADDMFDHDGQITKQHVRALTVCALAPRPGEVLWDIGGGSGSVAIEFLRSTPATKAVVFEQNPQRAETIAANARKLGVGELVTVVGSAPGSVVAAAADPDIPAPDVVFIGGGLTTAGVADQAVASLGPGGRIVANAVTVESAAVLRELRQLHGGHITEIAISREHAVGRFTTMKPALPVLQWSAVMGMKPPACAAGGHHLSLVNDIQQQETVEKKP
ncbi:precorrin-6y C5,15-methyltransferase (decarboxylating) subunit CbiE [Corynebacterium mendelii]|uniref:Precorrin-6y C5,15-methyltransferase (Decarboxylating) subunit CbiE n=1 Tax=Corynebacterium mendelii TaxID=2765362 RepID=A0A939IWK6_9CORY|nr:precorrin-6y C5,15-methyltransferase (decarboxylating) subunit CbiE [Corynebacterium mendelii]MBN9643520.1 precorrin-6y C5,15-methyltransferase (decarboxylating) subunit CbiE [Corynebacterium mendelii]